MTTRPHANRRDGYILVSVLSVLALVTGIASVMLLVARNATDTALLASASLEDEVLARSTLTIAAYRLFVLGASEDQVDGQQIRLDHGVVTMAVTSEAGKVDLNGSGKELLAAAFRASGLKGMAPETFAARVIDWRDGDDEVGSNGAEAEAYAEAGVPGGPRNGPFRTVDDLSSVLGMTPADTEVLRPLLTVYNAPGRLSVFAVPPPLLAALPGVSGSIVKDVLTVRKNRAGQSQATLADLLLVQSALIDTTRPRVFWVEMMIAGNDRRETRRITAVISAGATADAPYHILDWQDPS